MLPFLLIQTREDDDVAADELRSTTALGGFAPGELEPLRLEQAVLSGPVDWETLLDTHSGVILGGSPFNTMDADELKGDLQRACEAELRRLLDLVVPRDYPFFGACYGVSTLGVYAGGTVDREHSETAAAVPMAITEAGASDPILEGVNAEFDAFVGHKESMGRLPEGAVLLVEGRSCPVQMFRLGQNLYASQFHPEMDAEGLVFRLSKYRNHGYFAADELDSVIAAARRSSVTEPPKILSNFRVRYARSA
ncbi:glutamine amidotransferase [Falsarthrobacter nasiphocae]|uniref:GMP synthase (Glutamine-hydrolyzing) n=1 Tax=Falsarthrobacter nasiphocae TaxID=189863 RepID=A0AAE4C7P8_9MICC|nr:glutamine amidotransferase [Falsarthrobacter nasiphocae]MDR6891640.1 GMP synthase (glutamine-hydrolyzing) [Falsarthrobacter nasiphocae]